ncbi:MAG: sigma-70 family RNA polymerase sigma factor [Acidobacteria bacterium]|nr:sigma-70 family RNA polymerase sigma factor [Acidobacteriota bacterium]
MSHPQRPPRDGGDDRGADVAAPGEITALLEAWKAGDGRAADRLFEVVYPDLRRIALRQLRASGNVTFEPTEVVHEAYLKLEHAGGLAWESRLQFFALAAQVVRQVLVDRFRGQRRSKRGSGQRPVELAAAELELAAPSLDLLALDLALAQLADHDGEAARVVELRYFGGLSIPEIAQVLGVGTATVSRRWSMARAWLRRELQPA